jgi:hypothetical protein
VFRPHRARQAPRNPRIQHCRRRQGDTVIVEQTIALDALTRGSLRQACDSVAYVSDDIGPMIAAVFGGNTPIDVDAAQAHPHREAS